MESPPIRTSSVYDYSDKSVPQAGYAAIVFGAVNLFTGALALIRYWLYHRPAKASIIDDGFAAEQWVQTAPLQTAIAVGISVIVAAISFLLAWRIFHRSRSAMVVMLIVVIVPQLYVWFVLHSIAGSLVSVVVTAFLLRGARRLFQDHADA